LGLGFIPAPEKKLQDFSTHYAETLQSLETKINKNRQQNRNFVQFLTGDYFSLDFDQAPHGLLPSSVRFLRTGRSGSESSPVDVC
jgi:cyclopropane fatty-acyl-phospholipid synthase-like methyltransferase